MKKIGRVNRVPAYWGPNYEVTEVKNSEPDENPTVDATDIRVDSDEYTVDSEG